MQGAFCCCILPPSCSCPAPSCTTFISRGPATASTARWAMALPPPNAIPCMTIPPRPDNIPPPEDCAGAGAGCCVAGGGADFFFFFLPLSVLSFDQTILLLLLQINLLLLLFVL